MVPATPPNDVVKLLFESMLGGLDKVYGRDVVDSASAAPETTRLTANTADTRTCRTVTPSTVDRVNGDFGS